MSGWKNRIVGQVGRDPRTLHAHPANPRQHPPAQRQTVLASLDQLGFIDSVIVSARTSTILNGHLRVELALKAGEPTVPVVLVDVDAEEEALILATFDRLGTLAVIDGAKLTELLTDVEQSTPAVQAALDDWLTSFSTKEQRSGEPSLTEAGPADQYAVAVAVGPYRQHISLTAYRQWKDALVQEAGTHMDAIEATLKRRLGIAGDAP